MLDNPQFFHPSVAVAVRKRRAEMREEELRKESDKKTDSWKQLELGL